MNFNDHTVTWDTDNIPMKDRYKYFIIRKGLIEVYFSANEPEKYKHSEMNILGLPKFLMQSIINELQAWIMSSRYVRTSM
jgi:hypothetical protein